MAPHFCYEKGEKEKKRGRNARAEKKKSVRAERGPGREKTFPPFSLIRRGGKGGGRNWAFRPKKKRGKEKREPSAVNWLIKSMPSGYKRGGK